ncbi:hypothetical protein GmHk_04G011403 [Glycine max]|nr:hypothetical protein GmHk_04G011403 [Glycine max]
MEKHQVMLPTSSTSSTPFSSDFKVDYISTVHVENEVLRTQRMAISEQKESDKEFIKQHRYVFQTKSQVDVLDDGIPVEKIYEKDKATTGALIEIAISRDKFNAIPKMNRLW